MTATQSSCWRLFLAAILLAALAGCQQFRMTLDTLGDRSPSAQKPAPAAKQAPPVVLNRQQKGDVQIAIARSLEKHGQTEEAIKIYLEVVQKDPGRADACHRLALLHDKKGDSKASRTFYEKALRKDRNNAELLCDYGYSCYLQRRWKDAETNLRRALSLDPNLTRAHNNYGLLLARTGREEQALEQFVQAGCDEVGARCNLAFALTGENRPDEAREQFDLARAVAGRGRIPAHEPALEQPIPRDFGPPGPPVAGDFSEPQVAPASYVTYPYADDGAGR